MRSWRLAAPFRNLIRRCRKVGKDARALQALPDHVLADMGFEKMNILTGTNGSREILIIPHRFR